MIRCWLVTVATASGLVAAEPSRYPGVSVELAAGQSWAQPGKPMPVAIIFRPDPGFHIYWRQPGIVGLAPSVKWNLPELFGTGPLLWPEPQRVTMAKWGAWGYRRPVALVAEVTPPAGLDPAIAPTITIGAQVVWMACSKTCHPGSASLTLTLPVKAAPPEPTESAPLIAVTLREQPADATGWALAARETAGGYELTIEPPPGSIVPDDLYFFNSQRLVDSHHPQHLRRARGRAAILEMKQTELPEENVVSLDGLLHSAKGFAPGKAAHTVRISVPLQR